MRTVASAIFCFAVALCAFGEVLDNEAIVRMTQAGITPDVIVLKIQQSEVSFDISTDALIALRKAGVDNPIIKVMMLKMSPPVAAGGVGAPVEIRPPQMAIPTPLAESETCFKVELYTLGNNGWAWVPSGVCVTSDALTMDEQTFPFSSLKVQCIDPPSRVSVLGVNGTTDATFRFSDGKESFQLRGQNDAIGKLSETLTSAAPAVPHGKCQGDLRKLLAK
jgi:hypothetical protein